MAELLIKDGGPRDREIIDARPDGWPWGSCEGPPKFVVVKVANADIAKEGLEFEGSKGQLRLNALRRHQESHPTDAKLVKNVKYHIADMQSAKDSVEPKLCVLSDFTRSEVIVDALGVEAFE